MNFTHCKFMNSKSLKKIKYSIKFDASGSFNYVDRGSEG